MQDQLQTLAHFATAVYSVNKPDFVPVALQVFNEQIKKHKNVKPPSDAHPVCMTGHMHVDPRLNELGEYILNTAWNILDSQGYKMADKVTYFQSMWGQEHHKHSSMEQHVHNNGSQIVGLYFLECPENPPYLVFTDPRIGKLQLGLQEADPSKISMASDRISFKPEVGQLYFTNAWLSHGFSKNNSKTPFKFVHINIAVQQASPTQQKSSTPQVTII